MTNDANRVAPNPAPPTSINYSDGPSFQSEKVVTHRTPVNYDEVFMSINRAPWHWSLAHAQNLIVGGVPAGLEAVTKTYWSSGPIMPSNANSVTYKQTVTETLSSTTTMTLDASLGASGKGFTANVKATYSVANTKSTGFTQEVDETWDNTQGLDVVVVPWILTFDLAICHAGTDTLWWANAEVDNNAPGYPSHGGNRQITFNSPQAWATVPSTDYANTLVYDQNTGALLHLNSSGG